MGASFSKFIRPEQATTGGLITVRDLDIIEAILHYRFSRTSELVRLVGGNEDVTHRRLRRLWERRVISRFAFPFPRPHSEFVYYLENRQALDMLQQNNRMGEIPPNVEEEFRLNREADYARASVKGQHMKLGFLQHALMISRLHFCVEMACKRSGGRIHLQAWGQGGSLAGRKAEVPKIASVRERNEYFWEELEQAEHLPVEPDALFTLRLTDRPPDTQLAHFFYEADRGTMTTTDMLKKFRAYYYFIKKQQAHIQAFGVHPIRAILIETKNEARAKRLMQLVHHPLVCGPNKRSGLFWFTVSPMLDSTMKPKPGARPLPYYLHQPDVVLDRIWRLPDLTEHSLTDAENS